ncbi:MAG: hypothetical protein L6R19_23985 [Alphaproteobacteria bacterium]|nr:hypothetical protein [Alphaproteobacteria bacterium]
MTMFATPTGANAGPAGSQQVTVQHAVVVRTPDQLRKLNELLAAGWRVIQTTPFEMGAALLVIEAEGDPDAVEEFRNVFGAAAGTA